MVACAFVGAKGGHGSEHTVAYGIVSGGLGASGQSLLPL